MTDYGTSDHCGYPTLHNVVSYKVNCILSSFTHLFD